MSYLAPFRTIEQPWLRDEESLIKGWGDFLGKKEQLLLEHRLSPSDRQQPIKLSSTAPLNQTLEQTNGVG